MGEATVKGVGLVVAYIWSFFVIVPAYMIVVVPAKGLALVVLGLVVT